MFYDKLHTKYWTFRVKAYHLTAVHFAPRFSQYSSEERAAALSFLIFIGFCSARTHWLAGCPVVMIDRSAEGPHCGELGQGVALFSLVVLLLSQWLFSILTDSHRTTVKFLLISYLPFVCLADWLLSQFYLCFWDCHHIKVTWSFFCFTWPYLKRCNT